MSIVVAGIGVGLTALNMVGGARRGASQSRSQIASDKRSIRRLDIALGKLEGTAAAKREVAEMDMLEGLTMKGKQQGREKTKLVKQGEELNTEFSFFGESEQKLTDAVEDIDLGFEETKKMGEKSLDNSLAAITEWKGAERARLKSEKDGLRASIDANKHTDSFWENIFG
jgi:hypothetical protein